MEITLRSWQKDAYQSFENNNFNGILKVGTGKGKTIFAIYCIKEFLRINPLFRTCIIVPTINLMFQWKNELIKFMGIEPKEISLFYGREKSVSGKIVIFVVNSAINSSNLQKAHLLKKFDFMIADECHHYGSNLFSQIFENEFENKLGLSATPEREKDQEGTGKIIEGIGPKIFELNHLDDPKAIPQFVIWSILVKLTEKEQNEYEENSFEIFKLNKYISSKHSINPEDEDYFKKIKELAEKKDPAALKLLSLWSKQSGIKYQAENKIGLIKEIISMEKNSKIIIFNERIKFTERIYEELDKEFNLNLFFIHSGLSKNEVQDRLNKFRDIDKGVLIAPKMIDEGYDVPDASVAIVVSFTSSARQMIQRDGRILRKTDSKQNATRYSLIIENLEEDKYFYVLQKSEIASKAIEGEWLNYNSEDSTFSNSEEFKESFINYGKIKQHHKDQFKEWVLKKLDYYEQNFTNNIEEIERRLEFFTRFIDIIDILSEEYPGRWIELKEKLKRVPRNKVKYKHKIPHSEREILKQELRTINSRLTLPTDVFNSVIRFIDNEEFDLSHPTKEFLINLCDGDCPDIWPKRLFCFLRDVMLEKVQNIEISDNEEENHPPKVKEFKKPSKNALRKAKRYGKTINLS